MADIVVTSAIQQQYTICLYLPNVALYLPNVTDLKMHDSGDYLKFGDTKQQLVREKKREKKEKKWKSKQNRNETNQ